jgi:multidrug resistance efflux pump
LAAAAAELAKAQADFDRVERLYQSASASDEERRDVSRLLDVAKARQAEARDALALAREGTRPEDIADARAALAMEEAALKLAESGYREEEVAEAQGTAQAAAAAVAAIERQLAELTITAPADCVVEALDLQPGDLIAPNAPVISLVRDEPLWVRAYVPENRMNLQVGQKVWVRVDALPQRRFAAHVVFVARQAEFTPSNVQTPEERSKQVFRVKVVLDEGRGALRPGMAADVFLEPGT